ncbi:MAG: DUF4340 domain-containing protein [Planctomycetes bacterium]|nr:DUF4340 domain-containing protein [Planctomycetota bacterium]
MNESQRTLIFVVLAAVSVVGARFAGPSSPKPTAEISGIGEPFFPDFKDAEAAKSLEVTVYNPDTASVKPFAVVQDKSGLWRIPYAHNYPADGKDRLAKTAASMIGIKREGFAGRRENEHADFGVLDPKSEGATDLKGIGNRITLKDGNGTVLADYIIGKEVKGRAGMRYIRRPDEKATYIAKIDIQVSTKFADWIEADLLKIDGSRLNAIAIDTTSVDAGQRAVIDGDLNRLSRKSSTDPWKIEGLNEETEEPNQDEIRKLVSSLDELKIVGVRKKPNRLMQGLRDGEGLQLDQITVLDLDTKGFFLVRSQKGGGYRLIPKEGNVIATTDQGVTYDLKFGEIFNGTEEQVEVGFAAKEEGKEGETKDAEKKDEEKKDEEKKDAGKSLQKSRYLFVMVHFDADGLGPKPEKPVKPTPPEENAPEVEGPADAVAPTNTAPDPKQVYEAALAKYELDVKKFESDGNAYDEKVKAGEKLVKELNARFADWYYVVSGDSFENLRQGRKTLVKEKGANAPGNPGNPGIPGLPPGIQLPPGNN